MIQYIHAALKGKAVGYIRYLGFCPVNVSGVYVQCFSVVHSFYRLVGHIFVKVLAVNDKPFNASQFRTEDSVLEAARKGKFTAYALYFDDNSVADFKSHVFFRESGSIDFSFRYAFQNTSVVKKIIYSHNSVALQC